MIFPSILLLLTIAQLAFSKSNIQIHPLTTVINSDHKYKGYFSDPYYVPYNNEEKIYISGTTDKYLECDNFLSPECASAHSIAFNFSRALERKMGNTKFCGVAEIHPFQSGSGHSRSWDAVVTLHVQKDKCEGIDGWSVIVHARPENQSHLDSPPISWIGDKVLVGDFSKSAPANYDGKYFRTPPGELYLVYLKRYSKHPKRVGVFAWKMDNPRTLTHDSKPIPLLLPDENLNSEDYPDGNVKFKPIETSNIAAIKNKFVMAYSVGKYNNQSYELAAAYSDTFLPAKGQQYRKVLMSNPDHLWGSRGNKEVYYLLQADQKQGWHYVGDQVLAPGVPTVVPVGPNDSWVLIFDGYHPGDAPTKKGPNGQEYLANHRRPYFVDINVKVPDSPSAKHAKDTDLQDWITFAGVGSRV